MQGLSFRPEAADDLLSIYWFIADHSPVHAARHVQEIREGCVRLVDFPKLGIARDDLLPGLRVLALRQRVVVAYLIGPIDIEVLRVLGNGQDYEAILSAGPNGNLDGD